MLLSPWHSLWHRAAAPAVLVTEGVADLGVFPVHAELYRGGDRYMLVNADSLGGTFHNRSPVDEAALVDGAEIWLGNARFRFHARTSGQ